MEESESSRRKRPLDETFSKMPPSAAPAPSADVSWVSQPQVSEHEKWLAARVHSNSSSSKEISLEKLGFCWDQTDDEVRVYFSLRARVVRQCLSQLLPPHVRADGGGWRQPVRAPHALLFASYTASHHRSALLLSRSYFFEIKRTYAPIDPELSRTRIPKSQKNVSLRLRKQKGGRRMAGPALRRQ